MTKEQKETVSKELILLNIDDVVAITGWCKQVVRNTFAYDKEFPAIKKRKRISSRTWSIENIFIYKKK